MKSLPGCAIATLILFLSAPGEVRSYEVFLDHNTDGDINTFENLVVGPESAPIDIVLQIDPGETIVNAWIAWEFGETNPDGLACADIFGSVEYVPYAPLPDAFPFTNVVAYTCVCVAAPCPCDAQVVIEAQVAGLTEPGLYRLATLDFSRVGYTQDCTTTVWPSATFQTGSPQPQGTLVISDGTTAVGDGLDSRSWGHVKTSYR